jgi:hypothetical protein
MTLAHAVGDTQSEMTIEQTMTLLEEQTQRFLGMSLDDFYAHAEAGTLPDHPAVPHLILMSGARASSC